MNIDRIVSLGVGAWDRINRAFRPSRPQSHFECRGDDYPDRTFLVLRRGGNCGMGSYLSTMLGGIVFARTHGMVPVVDLSTQLNIYLREDRVGVDNAWEFYFEQPDGVGLHDIVCAHNVIVSARCDWPQVPTSDLHFLGNREALESMRKEMRRSVRWRQEMSAAMDKIRHDVFGNSMDDVLGCFIRGTDYVRLRPYGHPVQPSAGQMISRVREHLYQRGFSRVFLVTEDESIKRQFVQVFGKRLLVYPQQPLDYRHGYVGDAMLKDRSIDRRRRGEEYLGALHALSLCPMVTASFANGSLCAALWASDQVEFDWYDLGVYRYW